MENCESTNYNEASTKFSDWLGLTEKRLETSCHCPSNLLSNNNNSTSKSTNPTISTNSTTNLIAQQTSIADPKLQLYNRWKNVISQHQNLQNEVEVFGNQLNCELKKHLNNDKSITKEQSHLASDLEARWHKLWLKSLEQLVVVERTRRCPTHNTTIIGKSKSNSNSNGCNTNANNSLVKVQRRRPISYPNNYNDRLEWDYQHTLSLTGCHKENGSQIDLDSVDEQVTKNLTEFGENYELFFGLDEEITCSAQTVHSRPPSVEPAEKPEIAKAIVTSGNLNDSHEDVSCNRLMLTTPSSIFSVDASKCLRDSSNFKKDDAKLIWRFLLPIVFAIILIFSAITQEPHHMHKSYYHTQPPV